MVYIEIGRNDFPGVPTPKKEELEPVDLPGPWCRGASITAQATERVQESEPLQCVLKRSQQTQEASETTKS